MDGTIGQTQRQGRLLHRIVDLSDIRPPRRRDVDRLFEKGTVQRVRFIENGERLQLAVCDQPFDRDLFARDETLHEQPLG